MRKNSLIRLIVDNTHPDAELPDEEENSSEAEEVASAHGPNLTRTIDTRHPAVSILSLVISTIRASPKIWRMLKCVPSEIRAAWRDISKG